MAADQHLRGQSAQVHIQSKCTPTQAVRRRRRLHLRHRDDPSCRMDHSRITVNGTRQEGPWSKSGCQRWSYRSSLRVLQIERWYPANVRRALRSDDGGTAQRRRWVHGSSVAITCRREDGDRLEGREDDTIGWSIWSRLNVSGWPRVLAYSPRKIVKVFLACNLS